MVKRKQLEEERSYTIRTILQKELYEDYFMENDVVSER
jgi:hypothetical protein